MGTKLTITLTSETVYSEEEAKQLAIAFGEFMNEFDDDADPNTIKVQACDENSDEAKVYTAAEFIELIRSSSIEATIAFKPDNVPPFAVRLNEGI